MKSFLFASFSVLFLAVMIGCGSGTKVTGTVSYEDGSPVMDGDIYLQGETILARATIKEGKFSMGLTKDGQGVPPGKYEVQCSKELPTLKSDPNVEAYQLIEPKEFEVGKKAAQLNVKVRKLNAGGPAPGDAFQEKI